MSDQASQKLVDELLNTEVTFCKALEDFQKLAVAENEQIGQFKQGLTGVIESSKEVQKQLKKIVEALTKNPIPDLKPLFIAFKTAMEAHVANFNAPFSLYTIDFVRSLNKEMNEKAITLVQRLPRYLLLGEAISKAIKEGSKTLEPVEKLIENSLVKAVKPEAQRANKKIAELDFTKAFDELDKLKVSGAGKETEGEKLKIIDHALDELEKATLDDALPEGFNKDQYDDIFNKLKEKRKKTRTDNLLKAIKELTNREKPINEKGELVNGAASLAAKNITLVDTLEKLLVEYRKSFKNPPGNEYTDNEKQVLILKEQVRLEEKQTSIKMLKSGLNDLKSLPENEQKNNKYEIVNIQLKEARKKRFIGEAEKGLAEELEKLIKPWQLEKGKKDLEASTKAFENLENAVSTLNNKNGKFSKEEVVNISKLIGLAQGTLYSLLDSEAQYKTDKQARLQVLTEQNRKNKDKLEAKGKLEKAISDLIPMMYQVQLGGAAKKKKKNAITEVITLINQAMKEGYASEIDPVLFTKAFTYLNYKKGKWEKLTSLSVLEKKQIVLALNNEDLKDTSKIVQVLELGAKLHLQGIEVQYSNAISGILTDERGLVEKEKKGSIAKKIKMDSDAWKELMRATTPKEASTVKSERIQRPLPDGRSSPRSSLSTSEKQSVASGSTLQQTSEPRKDTPKLKEVTIHVDRLAPSSAEEDARKQQEKRKGKGAPPPAHQQPNKPSVPPPPARFQSNSPEAPTTIKPPKPSTPPPGARAAGQVPSSTPAATSLGSGGHSAISQGPQQAGNPPIAAPQPKIILPKTPFDLPPPSSSPNPAFTNAQPAANKTPTGPSSVPPRNPRLKEVEEAEEKIARYVKAHTKDQPKPLKPATPPPLPPLPVHRAAPQVPEKIITSVSGQAVSLKLWKVQRNLIPSSSAASGSVAKTTQPTRQLAAKIKQDGTVEYSLNPGNAGQARTLENSRVYKTLAEDIFDNIKKIDKKAPSNNAAIEIKLSPVLTTSQREMLSNAIEEEQKKYAAQPGEKREVKVVEALGHKPEEPAKAAETTNKGPATRKP